MYWSEQGPSSTTSSCGEFQMHRTGGWNLSVSTCDPSPRSNFEARDDDIDDECSPEERYYVGRPLFSGQENCLYFREDDTSNSVETTNRSEGPFHSRELSPPFTPCAAGEFYWQDSDLRTAKNYYDDARGLYLSIDVDGDDGNFYGSDWAPTATPESYGVYPSSEVEGYYDKGHFENRYVYDYYNFYQSMDNGDNTNEVGRNLVCAICDEDIVARGRRFGLLENCSHPFCLECIRRWRDQKGSQDRTNLRLCPLCRVESFLITPSEVYLPDGPDKTEVIRGYKEALARIPCKFVTAGEECPFGSSCYYKHDDNDHDDDEERGKRFLCGADGKVQALRKPKLSDYLFPCKQ